MTENTTPAPQAEPTGRPDYLSEKFATVEDQARAYTALESHLGGLAAGPTEDAVTATVAPTAAPEAVAPVGDVSLADLSITKTEVTEASVFDKYIGLHQEGGGLTAEQLAAFSVESGIPQAHANVYFDGLKATQAANANAVLQVAGGQEQFAAMSQWAANNLPEESIAAFNSSLEGGNPAQIGLAVEGLKARYLAANPTTPSLVTGNASTVATVAGYATSDEMKADMRNPEYKTNASFRAEVIRRMSVSDI